MTKEEVKELTEPLYATGIRKGRLELLKELNQYLKTEAPLTNQTIIDNFIIPKLETL